MQRMGRMMKKDTIITAAALAVFVLIYGSMQLFLPSSPTGTSDSTPEVAVEIRYGMTFRQAAEALKGQGLIRDTNMFVAMGRLTGLHRRLRPGQYVFTGRQSPWKVYAALRDGKSRLWAVTISEGEPLESVRQEMAASGIINAADFDRLTMDSAFMASLGVEAPSMEGYLYPETYLYPKGITPELALSMMVRRMKAVTGPLMARATELGYTENELLALASIVEKEAYLDSERELIAAVYVNRLKRGMRLQADPTVIYGVKPLTSPITRSDLRRHTPYNTYVINGLPPGPIAAPSRRSIEAVLNPADVPYLYFVSNNDGSHVFSSTLREHERAVRAYRAGKSQKGKNDNGGG